MQMVLGVMEGQIRGGYFPDYILDPSVIDCTAHPLVADIFTSVIAAKDAADIPAAKRSAIPTPWLTYRN